MAVFEAYQGFFSFFILPDISSGFQCFLSPSITYALRSGSCSIFSHSLRASFLRVLAYMSALTGLYPNMPPFTSTSYEMVFGLLSILRAILRYEYPLSSNILISKRSLNFNFGFFAIQTIVLRVSRSEERRVGKEC